MKALFFSLILLIAASSCTSPEYRFTCNCNNTTEVQTGEATQFQLMALEAMARKASRDSSCNWAVVEWVYYSSRDTTYSFTRN